MATLALQVERYISGSWTPWPNARVLPGMKITSDFGGTPQSPIVWGAVKPPELSLAIQGVQAEASTAYADLPVRVKLARGGVLTGVFTGIVQGKDETVSVEANEVGYRAVGLGEWVRRTRAISHLWPRRYAATRTTATSIEDPAHPQYAGGLINYLFWKAGLRPWAQLASYPNAIGYYHCDHALRAPAWTWANGEDGYAECGELARSVGGVITQTPDGVVRFVSPLSPSLGGVVATLSEGATAGIAGATYYGKLTTKRQRTTRFTQVRVDWARRVKQGMQQIWELPERVRVPAKGEAPQYADYGYVDIEFQPDYPIYRYYKLGAGDPLTMSEATPDNMGVSDFSQWPVTPRRNGLEGKATFFEVLEIGAQRVVGRFKHNYLQPLWLNTLRIQGEPVVVVHEGQAVVGTPGTQVNYPPNLYVSDQNHGEFLGAMLLAFHTVERPLRTADDVIFNPAIAAGVKVLVHSTRSGLSPAVLHLVTKATITVDGDGIRQSLDLIPIGDLPQIEDTWLWGDSVASGPKGVLW
jgi:hypothetical protein